MYKVYFAIIPLLVLTGCASTQLTPLQMREMQCKDLEGSFDNAYKATLQVFQDYGYIIKNSDYQSGVIQGGTATKRHKNWFWNGLMASSEATATIEQFKDNLVKERITLVDKAKSSSQYGTHENSKVVEDPAIYQRMYDDIQKEIFVRKNLSK